MLNGITRDSILVLARQLGIPVVEQAMPRELLYICDEAFFTGTAVEVTHLRSVDRIVIGDGAMGPITTALHKAYFDILHGLAPDRYNWLTPVKVREAVAGGKAVCLIEARDGAEDGRRKLLALMRAVPRPPRLLGLFDGLELSLALGAENVIHSALLAGRGADRWTRDVERLAGFRPLFPESWLEGP